MFDGLDEINWRELWHCWGTAEHVPDDLRALTSEDDETRNAALDGLWVIVHQGTMRTATPHVVPFLLELVTAPETRNKVGILELLSVLARDSYYPLTHDGVHKPVDYNDVGSPEWHEKLKSEPDLDRATHFAVAAGVPVYLRLFRSDPDGKTRMAAACVLAQCAGRSAEILPALLEGIERERDEPVLSSRLLTAEQLVKQLALGAPLADISERGTVATVAEEIFASPETRPLPRVIAAKMMLRLSAPEKVAAAFAYLREALHNLAEWDSAYRDLIRCDGGGIAVEVPLSLKRPDLLLSTENVVPFLLELVPTGGDGDSCEEATWITHVILHFLRLEPRNKNPWDVNRIPITELTAFQYETLLRLCDVFDRWGLVYATLLDEFRVYGLPDPRHLRSFLTGAEERPLKLVDPFAE